MTNMYNIDELTMIPSTNMEWFTKAIFGGRLIERGKITPVTGIKDATLLNMLDLAGTLLQADNKDCAWTPNQIAKLSEKELKVRTYKINLEQCIDDLERKRTIWMLSPGAKNTELPQGLEDATMAMLAPELSKEIEIKIFTGDSSTTSTDFDGVLKILKDSTEAIKVVGTTLTKDNVLTEVEKMFTAMSENAEDALTAGLEQNNLSFYVSSATILKVKMALASTFGSGVVINPNWGVEGDTVRYMGVEFEPVKGMPTNDMVLAQSSNLVFGTDLESDLESMRLGSFPAPNDSKIFIDGRLRLGFVIPFEDEVVYYSPDNTALAGRSLSASTPVTSLASDQIAAIENAETIEEVSQILGNDTRKTVVATAEKKIAELSKTE